MKQANKTLTIETGGRGLFDITRRITAWLADQKITSGLVSLFLMHTSASLTIQENADPDVLADLETFFRRVAPDDPSQYRHTAEGKDDMPAHIRTALTQSHLSIPIIDGRLALGTWQGIYLYEHRYRGHNRQLVLHVIGESAND